MLLLREGLLTSHAGPVLIPPSCPGLTITDEAGRLPGGQGYVAQAAIGVVVAILEPLQIGLDDALEWEKDHSWSKGSTAHLPKAQMPLFLSSQKSPILSFDQSKDIY